MSRPSGSGGGSSEPPTWIWSSRLSPRVASPGKRWRWRTPSSGNGKRGDLMAFRLGDVLRVVGRLLPILGRLGKGKATVAGVLTAVTGVAAKQFVGDVLTADNLAET